MNALRRSKPRSLEGTVSTAGGIVVGIAGAVFIGVGIWARREVRTALGRERIVSTPDARPPSSPVTSGSAARSMAEVIRRHTLESTGGRTYAETEEFVDGEGRGTSDAELALKDDRTGRPIENPDHALWVRSTTLQTALMQAYVSSRLAELTVALGVAFLAAGAGIAAAGAARR